MKLSGCLAEAPIASIVQIRGIPSLFAILQSLVPKSSDVACYDTYATSTAANSSFRMFETRLVRLFQELREYVFDVVLSVLDVCEERSASKWRRHVHLLARLCVYVAVGVLKGSCSCLLGIGRRGQVRRKYNIPPEPCNNGCVHCLCHCCALCQEHRELKIRTRGAQKLVAVAPVGVQYVALPAAGTHLLSRPT